jgi:hypothetical protein
VSPVHVACAVDRCRPRRPQGGKRRVARERGDEGPDVGVLPRVDVAADELAQALVVERAERRLLALFRQVRVGCPVRALERAVDRRRSRVEDSATSRAENARTSRRLKSARRDRGHAGETPARDA